jgi:hypothetical protein
MFATLLPKYHCSSIALACLFAFLSAETAADGLAEFREALKQLQSSEPIALNAQFKLVGRSGEHHELIEREGLINLRLEDNRGGMKVAYAADLVNQLHSEELAKLEDENVKNSALNAVGQFDYWEWRELLYPTAQLELALGRYEYLGEKAGEWDGKVARVLSFRMPKEKVDLKFRKYIKKYKNHLRIWIDDQGVPLASSVSERGSGRVFIVIGFTFNNEFQMEYQQHAGRLIGVRREVKEQTEGATMQSYRHFITTVKSVQ